MKKNNDLLVNTPATLPSDVTSVSQFGVNIAYMNWLETQGKTPWQEYKDYTTSPYTGLPVRKKADVVDVTLNNSPSIPKSTKLIDTVRS